MACWLGLISAFNAYIQVDRLGFLMCSTRNGVLVGSCFAHDVRLFYILRCTEISGLNN